MANLKYINHLNETIEFYSENYFVDSYKLRDYSWNYDTDFNKIKNFNRLGVTSKKLTVSVLASSAQTAISLYNSLFETFEADVLAQSPGKFYIGDYYFTGFVSDSTKSSYSSAQNLLTLELNIISDTNIWTRETSYSFSKDQTISGHGYVYGYPYNYASGANKNILNDSLADSNFKLTIYGAASNPEVYFGDHLYSIETDLETNEYLEIDSKSKTIYKVQSDGTRVNALNSRDRDNYIFQKIPTGTVSVSWNNNFGFDITLFDERSEPKWSA
ncbi:MAG: hypothetical protein RUMPE_01337 [Eubacteriales bacterium SKADARSKE-1]|nr:hypothetical protein [Eubacteriales bacterium SKADARSKE-1]